MNVLRPQVHFGNMYFLLCWPGLITEVLQSDYSWTVYGCEFVET